jgi:hypothetical protein
MTDNLPAPILRRATTPAPAAPRQALSERLEEANAIAKAGAEALPKGYRGNPGAALLAIDWAAKRGLDLLTAIQNVAFINGRPVVDASFQHALATQAGYTVRVEHADNESAVVSVSRDGTLIGDATFTIAEAKAAGLTSKDTWKSYASDMLVARARSRAIRRHAPDAIMGLRLHDELDDPTEPLTIEARAAEAVDGGWIRQQATTPAPPAAAPEPALEPTDTELDEAARAVSDSPDERTIILAALHHIAANHPTAESIPTRILDGLYKIADRELSYAITDDAFELINADGDTVRTVPLEELDQ